MDYADDKSPFPRPVIYVPRQILFHTLELRDVYKPHRAIATARLELLSA
jgi:hypothetical protein